MLRGLIKGATTAAGASAIVLSSVSLIAPTTREAVRPGIGAPDARPSPPEMAAVERSVPTRPEAMPERPLSEPAVSERPASDGAVPDAALVGRGTEKAVDLAIPAGSRFNRPREDFQPVPPEAEEAARGFASAPGSRPAAEGPVAAPAPDTSSGDVPAAGTVVVEVAIPEAGEAPALPAPVEDGVPLTLREVVPIEDMPQEADLETRPAEEATRAAPQGSEANIPSVARVDGAAKDPVSPEAPPTVLQSLSSAPGGGGPTTGQAPPLPPTVVDAAPRARPEASPVGTAPEALATIDTALAEPGPDPSVSDPSVPDPSVPDPSAPVVSETIAPPRAPVAADSAALAGADAPSERPVSASLPRLPGSRADEDAPPSEASSGAPAVLERISGPAPAPAAPTDRQARGPAFLDPRVQLGARQAASDAEAPVRIVPRRIVLDTARTRSASPDTESSVPRSGDGRALTAHAAAFDNPEDKPLFSIVLIDDPSGGVSRSAMLDLDMPLTFAIDPARLDAAAVAQAYRDAGHEVLMLAEGLPVAAPPEDIETAVARARAALPQAVGVLDRRSGGFVRNRTALPALLGPMAEAGLGLVGYGGGFGNGLEVAERDGVPSDAVFRVIDDGGERATALTRYLDRATFEAEQQGRVIVVGRSRPAMVTALLSWRLGRRAGTVALAPVSAVLLASERGS